MRLISYNYTQLSATDVEASSSNVNFPVSNVKHQFRSKQWRSSGNFVIDSTNNKIDFKESGGGAELTATISSATYTPTTLATEIKTQLDTEGADTYTVTFSENTGLWTIASDGAYLDLLINTGTNEATNALKNACGFADSDKTGALTYTGSTIAIHTEEWVTFDLQTTEDINSLAILWAKEDGIRLSSSAVIKIQANATDSWSSPSVDETLTINNTYSIASHYFSTDQSYRYWRISIVDPGNANLYVNLGSIVLGKSITVDCPENGYSFEYRDNSKTQTTDFGNEYVDEYPITTAIEFDYKYFDNTDMSIFDSLFIQNGVKTPVFVVLDETGVIHNKDQVYVYGKLDKKLKFNHVYYDIYNTKFKIMEIL